MGIVVCGDVDPIRVQLLCERYLKARPADRIERQKVEEPDGVKTKRITE